MDSESQTETARPTFWDPRAPIYLIESPSADDLYSGQNEGQSLVSILMLGEIEVKYFLVTDADHFEQALNEIAQMIMKREDSDSVLPFIHISAHGSLDGLQLTDGDEILWARLTKLLDDLHKLIGPFTAASSVEATIAKCFLSLSSCSAYINYMAVSPVVESLQGVLGPTEDVGWCQSLLAFASFYYQAFVLKKTFVASVEAMNIASCDTEKPIFALKMASHPGFINQGKISPSILQRFQLVSPSNEADARKLNKLLPSPPANPL